MPVALLRTETVESILRDAAGKGCYIEHDKSAGTAKAHRKGEVVFQALQKGKDGPWICRFVANEKVSWASTTAD